MHHSLDCKDISKVFVRVQGRIYWFQSLNGALRTHMLPLPRQNVLYSNTLRSVVLTFLIDAVANRIL